MYSKIILFVLFVFMGAFFYLHTVNPGVVTFIISKDMKFVQPLTVFVSVGFFAGVAFAVFNSLYSDAVRAIRDLKAKRDKRQMELSESNYRDGAEELLRGNPGKARQLLKKALGGNPSDIDITLRLAESSMDAGAIEDAVRVLDAALLKNPGNMELLYAAASYALITRDTHKAVKTFKGILNKYPSNSFALKGLRDIRIGEGAWERASELQKKLVSRGQGSADAVGEEELLTGLLYESAAWLMAEGDGEGASGAAREALKNDDSFIPAHLLLGEVLYAAGDTRGAAKVWEKAYNRYNDARLFLRLEDMYIEESDPQNILDRYSKAINSRPGDTNLRLLLSRLYLRLEMVDNAIEELERLSSEGEEGFYHRVLLAEAYSRREPGSKAATLFKTALGLDKEFPPPFKCSKCDKSVLEWHGRCPSCRRWNTLVMNADYSPSSAFSPPPPPALPHGDGKPE